MVRWRLERWLRQSAKCSLNVTLSSLDLTIEGSTQVYSKKDSISQQHKRGLEGKSGSERDRNPAFCGGALESQQGVECGGTPESRRSTRVLWEGALAFHEIQESANPTALALLRPEGPPTSSSPPISYTVFSIPRAVSLCFPTAHQPPWGWHGISTVKLPTFFLSKRLCPAVGQT